MKKNFIPILMISSILIINIISIIVFKEINVIGVIVSITGIISVVMSAKGYIGCYYLGIINSIGYIIIAINSSFYGTAILHCIFYLPMQFIGIYNWKRNLKKESLIVNTREMNLNKLLTIVAVSVIFTLLYSIILSLINGNSPLIDAAVTGLSVIAMILSVKRYKEQWLFWIAINITNTIMWLIAAFNNIENSILMTSTWFLCLINSIYGFINWGKLVEKK